MTLVLILIVFLNLFYVVLFWQLNSGWNRIDEVEAVEDSTLSATVVVPFRNEAHRIKPLLESILELNGLVRTHWIFVDDHSEDQGSSLIQSVLESKCSFAIIPCPQSVTGKKQALIYGLEQVQSEVVLTTDADCLLPPNWLNTMLLPFNYPNIQCVTGPVDFIPSTGFRASWMQLEFISLIGIGAAAIGLNKPFLGNGANLAYRTRAFRETLATQTHQNEPGGDDVRTIAAISKKYGANSIAFAKGAAGLVRTKGPANWREFIQQRKRWSSKNAGLPGVSIILSLAVIYNVLLILLFLASILNPFWWKWFISSLIIKVGMEALFLLNVLPFFDRTNLIKVLLPGQLFHIPYVIAGAIWSINKQFHWKGRLWKP
jgi:cellulose synthase/poly-beta-1,6-N-acetylglucosamine synthase-like glycosyltransferase